MAAIIAVENAAEHPLAELNTTSEVMGLGLRSVLTPQIADVWRMVPGNTPPIGQVTLDVDLGRDVACRLVLLTAPRDGVLPVAGSTYQALGYSAAGAVVHDSGQRALAPNVRGVWPYVLPADITARRWRVVFRYAAGQPYAQFGRVWIGPALVTSRAVSYGQQRAVIDGGSGERAGISGVRYASSGARWRQPQWSLPLLTPTEADVLEAMVLAVGTTGQVFAAPSILTPERDGVLGVFRAAPVLRLVNHLYWATEINLEEDC